MKQFIQHFLPLNVEANGAGASNQNALAGTSIETDTAHVRNTRPFFQDGTISRVHFDGDI